MKVALYIRSSKDQHKVSCEAQKRQLEGYVASKGDNVSVIYTDQGLSSTKDIRPQFNDMMIEASKPGRRFDKICCLEMSRLGREQHSTSMALHTLREKYGVEVDFMNMPVSEAQSSNTLMEATFLGFSNYHSLVSKEKGVEGMKQNVIDGFRAGGIAPFGYKLEYVDYGRNKRKEMVKKSRLKVKEETSPIVIEYLERRSRNESRKSIFVDFCKRGIKTPRGNTIWSESTGKSWEDNVMQYLGHTVFNVTNEKIRVNGDVVGFKGGKKYKPKSEWIICENTHTPLISEEVGEAIKALKKKGIRASRYDLKRTYVLSGLLKCADCGYNYIGDRVTYRCNAQTKAGSGCNNNGISCNQIEDAIFSFLHHTVLSSDCVKNIIDETRKRLNENNPEIAQVSQRLRQIDKEFNKLLDLYQDGLIDKDTFRVRVAPINEQKQIVSDHLVVLKASQNAIDVSEKEIQEVVYHLSTEIKHADRKVVKATVHAMIDEIVVGPMGENGERILNVKGSYLPITRVNMVTPRGLEPLFPA